MPESSFAELVSNKRGVQIYAEDDQTRYMLSQLNYHQPVADQAVVIEFEIVLYDLLTSEALEQGSNEIVITDELGTNEEWKSDTSDAWFVTMYKCVNEINRLLK